MPYVSRGDNGKINGMFVALQPGFAEEYLPDDDPEVLAFLNPPKPINPALDTKPAKTAAQILGVV